MSTNMQSKSLNIGVIGGSIAGCSAAIILSKAGHDVTVFERSAHGLKGRGAGIVTTIPMLQSLIENEMIAPDFPYFLAHEMPFIGRRAPDDEFGHIAWKMPLNAAAINWADLYINLRRRVSDAIYHAGTAARSARRTGDTVTVTFDNGSERSFDLLIFADGYHSLGRSLLFPDVDVTYRGYVAWRGVLEEQYLSDSAPLETAIPRLSYKGLPGHLVLYFVPGKDGSTTPGERWVNWLTYIPVTEAELPAFMVDKNGKQQAGSMSPGLMRPEEELRLKRLMSDHLPTYYSRLITASENTYAQPIYTVNMPAYARDRMCLFGDAGSVAQPFTGSGVFKAVTNASDLATALETHETVEGALSEWSAAQAVAAKRVVVLGEQEEQALIWAAADFSQMDSETAANWWHAAVKFPEELDYGKTD